jgi:hypothetical protein
VIRVNATVDAVDERKRNGLEVGGGMKWAFRPCVAVLAHGLSVSLDRISGKSSSDHLRFK